MNKIILKELILINQDVDLDEYIEFRELVKKNMLYPEWLGDFTKEDLTGVINNGGKIWIYHLNNEPVCSMMYIPATEKSTKKLNMEAYNYHDIADYGPMMVNPKYVGNGLQYQMLQELDKYAISMGCKYAVGAIHPDNLFSINNLVKDNFKQIGQKEFSRGLRNIYFKEL